MATSSTQKKKRGSKRSPYRCTICPGRPVRTSCPHGKAKHSLQKVAADNLGKEASNLVKRNSTAVRVTQLDATGTEGSSVAANAQRALSPASLGLLPGLESAPLLGVLFPPAANPFPIVAHNQPDACSTVPENSNNNMAVDKDLTLENEDQISCDESPSKASRKPTASLSNPVFGMVEGAGRGNQSFRMPRSRSLRLPMQDQAKATLRYTRLIKDLICRAEAVSYETGCWLHLAAQHPNSSLPFMHFSSRRLRKEAGPELQDIHQLFSKVMGALVCSGKRVKMEASMQVAEAEEKLHSTEVDLQQAKSDLAEKDRVIAVLRAKTRLLDDYERL